MGSGRWLFDEILDDEAGDVAWFFGGEGVEHEVLKILGLFGEPFDEAGADFDLGHAGFFGAFREAGPGGRGYVDAQDHTWLHGLSNWVPVVLLAARASTC